MGGIKGGNKENSQSWHSFTMMGKARGTFKGAPKLVCFSAY